MSRKHHANRPYVGFYVDRSGRRMPILKGDWTKPPKKVFSNIQRLNIYSSEGFVSCDTNFLARFPRLHTVRFSVDRPIDLSGLYHLPGLRDLTILSGWISPKHIVLDLSRLPSLRRLSTPFSVNIHGWERLGQLTELRLDHIYGIKRLNLSYHPRLKTLDLGPANGVQEVSLGSLPHLRSLGLVCMARLNSLLGSEFYKTVTSLDIRASNNIPPLLLARFTRLRTVTIGIKSTISINNFPLCKPRILRLPV